MRIAAKVLAWLLARLPRDPGCLGAGWPRWKERSADSRILLVWDSRICRFEATECERARPLGRGDDLIPPARLGLVEGLVSSCDEGLRALLIGLV
jgi:hypothetical protein